MADGSDRFLEASPAMGGATPCVWSCSLDAVAASLLLTDILPIEGCGDMLLEDLLSVVAGGSTLPDRTLWHCALKLPAGMVMVHADGFAKSWSMLGGDTPALLDTASNSKSLVVGGTS